MFKVNEDYRFVWWYHPTRNVQRQLLESALEQRMFSDFLTVVIQSGEDGVTVNDIAETIKTIYGGDFGRYGLNLTQQRSFTEYVRPILDTLAQILVLVSREKYSDGFHYKIRDKASVQTFLNLSAEEQKKFLKHRLLELKIPNRNLPKYLLKISEMHINQFENPRVFIDNPTELEIQIKSKIRQTYTNHIENDVLNVYDLFKLRPFSLLFKVLIDVTKKWYTIESSAFPGLKPKEIYPFILTSLNETSDTIDNISDTLIDILKEDKDVDDIFDHWLTIGGQSHREVDVFNNRKTKWSPDVSWMNAWADFFGIVKFEQNKVFLPTEIEKSLYSVLEEKPVWINDVHEFDIVILYSLKQLASRDITVKKDEFLFVLDSVDITPIKPEQLTLTEFEEIINKRKEKLISAYTNEIEGRLYSNIGISVYDIDINNLDAIIKLSNRIMQQYMNAIVSQPYIEAIYSRIKHSEKIPLNFYSYSDEIETQWSAHRVNKIDEALIENIEVLGKQEIPESIKLNYPNYTAEQLFELSVSQSLYKTGFFNKVYLLGHELTGKKVIDGFLSISNPVLKIIVAYDAKSKAKGKTYLFSETENYRLLNEIKGIYERLPVSVQYLFIVSNNFSKSNVKNNWQYFREKSVFLLPFKSSALNELRIRAVNDPNLINRVDFWRSILLPSISNPIIIDNDLIKRI